MASSAHALTSVTKRFMTASLTPVGSPLAQLHLPSHMPIRSAYWTSIWILARSSASGQRPRTNFSSALGTVPSVPPMPA